MIVIGLLRFVGLMNAAVWFGAAFFFTWVAEPAVTSSEGIQQLLGPKNLPYFSVAIGQLVAGRFFGLFLVCSVVAVLHMGAEWLYFGRYPRRGWLALVFGLCLGGLIQVYGIQPKLKRLLQLEYGDAQRRESAGHSFRVWHGVSTTVDILLLGGLGIYLWRVANPPDEMRFVDAGKFRS